MSEQIFIGVIISPHGLKGEVKAKFFTNNTSELSNYKFYDSEEKSIKFKKLAPHKGEIFICKIEGINDRNQSELLKGKQIFIKKQDLPNTESDQYYIHDLENMDVLNHEKEKIGTISNIMDYGAGTVIEITDLDSKKAYIRFNDDNFPEVNVEKNFVIFNK